MLDKRPADWNWVVARHECTAAKMLGILKKLAARDVATRNEQLGDNQYVFWDHGDNFAVNLQGSQGGSEDTRVHFALSSDGQKLEISRGFGKPAVGVLSLALGKRGQCKWVKSGEEMDPWQVLQWAIGPLLFG